MMWVVLWALGVIAFLVFVFRDQLRLFLVLMLGLAVFIASVILQASLIESGGYAEFVGAAARIGWVIVIFAVTVLVADAAAMIVYTFRHGESDRSGKVVTQNRPLRSMSLGYGRLVGRSTIKHLGGKSEFVTMESLLDGTASFGERMLVAGIVTLFISFFLVFVGAGLMLMKRLLFMALVPVIPGLFIYRAAREAWSAYGNAKKKLRGRV